MTLHGLVEYVQSKYPGISFSGIAKKLNTPRSTLHDRLKAEKEGRAEFNCWIEQEPQELEVVISVKLSK